MVMTLRKRVPPPSPKSSSSSSDTDSEGEWVNNKKARKGPKPGPKARNDSESEFESDSESGKENGYENLREQRIRENRERMEKLGIFSLSSQMFNAKNKKKPVKNKVVTKKRYPSILPRAPRPYDRRRSERLSNEETVASLKEMGISIPAGWKPEVYTEEDEKLLGDCEKKWTLEVDGYGEDGELEYDPVCGTSCHQCRNKTARKHTYCSKCRSPKGQLCGDCLYTRYGENVLEAVQNPTWLCPACRGICNCSRCRQDKGWSRLTVSYTKVIQAGYKSIAHYLILNQRAGNKPKQSEDGTVMVDLTKQEPVASMNYDCSKNSADSDRSADWSESESDDSDDDDDSKVKKKNTTQSIEKKVNTAEPEILNEAVGAADKKQVLQELNY